MSVNLRKILEGGFNDVVAVNYIAKTFDSGKYFILLPTKNLAIMDLLKLQ